MLYSEEFKFWFKWDIQSQQSAHDVGRTPIGMNIIVKIKREREREKSARDKREISHEFSAIYFELGWLMQSVGWCEFRYLCARARTARRPSARMPLPRRASASRPDWRVRDHRPSSLNCSRCTWRRVRRTSLYRTRFVLYKLPTRYSPCNITQWKEYSTINKNILL